MRRILIILVALVAMPASSFAQSGSLFFDPISMDRLTPVTTLSFDIGYEVWDQAGNTDVNVIGIQAGGHFVDQRTGFGGYANLPLSYVEVNGNFFGFDLNRSDLMLGNLEAGGMFTKWLSSATLVFHGGIAFPTANDSSQLAGLQDLANSPRYGDFVLRDPNTTWLRLGVSPMGRSGNFLWRADLGIDLALNDDNPDAFQYSPVMHLSLGAGIDLGSAVLLGELVNLLLDNPQGDDSSSTLSLGARFGTGKLAPGVSLILPLGFDGDSDFERFAIAASLSARL